MSYLLALDPGIRGCGVALFKDGRLYKCAYVRNPIKIGDSPDAVLSMATAVVDWVGQSILSRADLQYVFEWPRIYTDKKKKKRTDNNDLLPLVGVGCAVMALLDVPRSRFYPSDWKGQMDEEPTTARVRSRLAGDAGELAAFEAGVETGGKTYGHNVVDACGIGLCRSGRFEPQRVFTR